MPTFKNIYYSLVWVDFGFSFFSPLTNYSKNIKYTLILGILPALTCLVILRKSVNRSIINSKTIRINYFYAFEIFYIYDKVFNFKKINFIP